jgi:hypothetical protein
MELPNNHSAVLRFKTNRIGDILGVPFRQVEMKRCVIPWRNSVADHLQYAYKTTGTYRSDRSIGSAEGPRFIAPPNLVELMAAGQVILYDSKINNIKDLNGPVISTMPMPALMKLLNYNQQVEFRYQHGVNLVTKVQHSDCYVSQYFPDPKIAFSRATITGDELIIEFPGHETIDPDDLQHHVKHALYFLGIDRSHADDDAIVIRKQAYAKIEPIDNEIRRDFIYWATANHNVYSLGRFATWRPHLQMDDLIQDVHLIEQWMARQDRYAVASHWQKDNR